MAFSLGGLGGVTSGYLDTQQQQLKTALEQLQLQDAQTQPLVQGLQGDALMQLNQQIQGGGQGGGAPQGGPPGQPQAPMPPQPPGPPQGPAAAGPAGAPPGAPQGGPPPIGAPQPQAAGPAADPNNPANWTSFQVASGPGQGQGGQLAPSQPPGPPTGPGGFPAKPVPTQSFTPPGAPAPQGGGGPPGAGNLTQPPGGSGGQPQQTGPLSLQSVIKAVTDAAAKRGQKVDPSIIARAVQGFIPLMNADAQSQWKMISAQLAQERIGVAQENATRMREQGDARIKQGDERLEQGNKRLAQADERNKLADRKEAFLELQKRMQNDRLMQDLMRKEKIAQQQNDQRQVMQLLAQARARVGILAQGATATGKPVDKEAMDAAVKESLDQIDQLARLTAVKVKQSGSPTPQPGDKNLTTVRRPQPPPTPPGMNPGSFQLYQ